MVTHSHYDIEDIPNTQDPQTAVEMYRQQREPLKYRPEEIKTMLGEIESVLGDEYEKAQANGDGTLTASIAQTWANIQHLANSVAQQDSALNGADTAIDTLEGQVKSVSHELKDLLSAIGRGSTNHPKLKEFSNRIYQMGFNASVDYAEETAGDMMHEEITNEMATVIRKLTGAEYVLMDADIDDDPEVQADIIFALIMGHIEMSEYQKSLYLQLIESLDLDEE